MEFKPGSIVDGKYELIALRGEGGMSSVFVARHLLTKQRVALKILTRASRSRLTSQRFKLEVSISSRVQHPGIVKVFDAGKEPEDSRYYLAMELLEGRSLREYLDAPGFDTAYAIKALQQTMDAMAAAHTQGVVHRDLKPENLFLVETHTTTPRARVLDFGIARDLDSPSLTRTGAAVGTAYYMAPEQSTGRKDIGPSADVWAFGVMFYEILTGRLPFDGPNPHAVVIEAVTQPHTPLSVYRPDLPKPWSNFIDLCLAKDPKRRPQNAGALIEDVGDLIRLSSSELTEPVVMLPKGVTPDETLDAPPSLRLPELGSPTLTEMSIGTWHTGGSDSPPPQSNRKTLWIAAVAALGMGAAASGIGLTLTTDGLREEAPPAATANPPAQNSTVEPEPEARPEPGRSGATETSPSQLTTVTPAAPRTSTTSRRARLRRPSRGRPPSPAGPPDPNPPTEAIAISEPPVRPPDPPRRPTPPTAGPAAATPIVDERPSTPVIQGLDSFDQQARARRRTP